MKRAMGWYRNAIAEQTEIKHFSPGKVLSQGDNWVLFLNEGLWKSDTEKDLQKIIGIIEPNEHCFNIVEVTHTLDYSNFPKE